MQQGKQPAWAEIVFGALLGFLAYFIVRADPDRHLHRRPERARGASPPSAAPSASAAPRWRTRCPRSLTDEEKTALRLSAAARDRAGRPLFQAAVAARLQGHRRDADAQHRVRSRERDGEQQQPGARGGDEGPAQHRAHRPAALHHRGAQSLRHALRGEESRSRTSWAISSRSCASASPISTRRRWPWSPQSVVPDGADVEPAVVQGISINDLRKNLRELNEQMDKECASSAARYGIRLDAALITSIDPPRGRSSRRWRRSTRRTTRSRPTSAWRRPRRTSASCSRSARCRSRRSTRRRRSSRSTGSRRSLTDLRKNGAEALPLYLRNIRLALYAQGVAHHPGDEEMSHGLHHR